MPEQTYISQEWKKDILKEIGIVSAQVREELGCQKSCRRSRASPEPPGMRGLGPRRPRARGQEVEEGRGFCDAKAESRDPRSCCRKLLGLCL